MVVDNSGCDFQNMRDKLLAIAIAVMARMNIDPCDCLNMIVKAAYHRCNRADFIVHNQAVSARPDWNIRKTLRVFQACAPAIKLSKICADEIPYSRQVGFFDSSDTGLRFHEFDEVYQKGAQNSV